MDRRTPLVSIGLPVYNGEKYLRRALESLLTQDYQHLELIISDNASTDETGEIGREFLGRDGRIRYSRNEDNKGIVWNFGHVLELARGDYFMWASHDDQWGCNFISSLIDELAKFPQSALAMSACQRVHETGEVYDVIRFNGTNEMSYFGQAMAVMTRPTYSVFNYSLHRTAFLKRAFAEFPQSALADWLFICCLALSTRFRYVDQVLYVRQKSGEPVHIKYANEQVGKLNADPLISWRNAWVLGEAIRKSSIIPPHRKLFAPVLILRYALTRNLLGLGQLYLLFHALLGKLIGATRRDSLLLSVRQLLNKNN